MVFCISATHDINYQWFSSEKYERQKKEVASSSLIRDNSKQNYKTLKSTIFI